MPSSSCGHESAGVWEFTDHCSTWASSHWFWTLGSPGGWPKFTFLLMTDGCWSRGVLPHSLKVGKMWVWVNYAPEYHLSPVKAETLHTVIHAIASFLLILYFINNGQVFFLGLHLEKHSLWSSALAVTRIKWENLKKKLWQYPTLKQLKDNLISG